MNIRNAAIFLFSSFLLAAGCGGSSPGTAPPTEKPQPENPSTNPPAWLGVVKTSKNWEGLSVPVISGTQQLVSAEMSWTTEDTVALERAILRLTEPEESAGAVNVVSILMGDTPIGASTIERLSGTATLNLGGAKIHDESAPITVTTDVTGRVGQHFRFAIMNATDIRAVGTDNRPANIINPDGFPIVFPWFAITEGSLFTNEIPKNPTVPLRRGMKDQVAAMFGASMFGEDGLVTGFKLSLALKGLYYGIFKNIRLQDVSGTSLCTWAALTSEDLACTGLDYTFVLGDSDSLTLLLDIDPGVEEGTMGIRLEDVTVRGQRSGKQLLSRYVVTKPRPVY